MEENKSNWKKDNPWFKSVMIFYVKTTSWIIFPLVLASFLAKYVSKTTGSQVLFFIIVIAGFGITCFGIYREIKGYKKGLDKEIKENKQNNGK